MKKVLLLMLVLVSMTATAQRDVTKFLGIPVDGYKPEMKKKLMEKGFTYNSPYDYFEGKFDGRDVQLFITTNNNKVWRIMVYDKTPYDKEGIKIRYNQLCRQFLNSQDYVAANLIGSNYLIFDGEDVCYEMSVYKKTYKASFFQCLEQPVTESCVDRNRVKESLLQEYTQEEIVHPSDKLEKKIKDAIQRETEGIALEKLGKKSVWFMIRKDFGQYSIVMSFENEYNHPAGEDL
ncbi:MAG: hypothetical protein IKO73_04180 [Bacteroidaceae bacterium]|nr:hypothetical protein [Bacteroidaceae bacterium]